MYIRQAPSEATKTAALVEGTAELPVLLGLVVVAVVGEVEPVGGGINWAPVRPWRDGQD